MFFITRFHLKSFEYVDKKCKISCFQILNRYRQRDVQCFYKNLLIIFLIHFESMFMFLRLFLNSSFYQTHKHTHTRARLQDRKGPSSHALARQEGFTPFYLGPRSRFVAVIGLSVIKEKPRRRARARDASVWRVPNLENRVSRLYRLLISLALLVGSPRRVYARFFIFFRSAVLLVKVGWCERQKGSQIKSAIQFHQFSRAASQRSVRKKYFIRGLSEGRDCFIWTKALLWIY